MRILFWSVLSTKTLVKIHVFLDKLNAVSVLRRLNKVKLFFHWVRIFLKKIIISQVNYIKILNDHYLSILVFLFITHLLRLILMSSNTLPLLQFNEDTYYKLSINFRITTNVKSLQLPDTSTKLNRITTLLWRLVAPYI